MRAFDPIPASVVFNQFIELGWFYSIIVCVSLEISYSNGIHPLLGFWTSFPRENNWCGRCLCVRERENWICESMYAWLWHALRFTICSRIGDYLASSQFQCCGRSVPGTSSITWDRVGWWICIDGFGEKKACDCNSIHTLFLHHLWPGPEVHNNYVLILIDRCNNSRRSRV